MRIRENRSENILDINEVYASLLETHASVFVLQVDDQVFFYKPIGRADYKYVASNAELNDFQKEEVICETCTLWPEHFDFEDCDAGIPTKLSKAIIRNSYLESNDLINSLIQSFRLEMYDRDNQITCIINEAFPQFDIEEIESWSMEKTAKYLSRAEWKIVNLRGGMYNYDPITFDLQGQPEALEQHEEESYTENVNNNYSDSNTSVEYKAGETLEERQARLEREGFFKQKKQKLTPEKLAEMQAKYPDMDWSSIVTDGDSNSPMGGTADTRPAALRPGW